MLVFPVSPDGDVLRVHCRPVPLADGTAAAIVFVDGEVDAETTPVLQEALLNAVDGYPTVYCDLNRVVFFGAAGANSVAAAGRRAATVGHRLELCGAHGLTRQVLAIAGLDRLLTVSE
ncbi:STAS domain-containing protein [Actinoplanes sp. NBC_00393]|uniref:STAS domain-containing protein n=1 Tax=Actinoplanes sp. NBC_00393 TaxID=2975953 RepID=UPI002E1D2879